MAASKDSFFEIIYRDPKDGKNVTLKARTIQDSSLGLSFISVSDFIFDTQSVVINPEEEAREKKFSTIKSLHLSIYSVLSIAEVGPQSKTLSFVKDKSNLVMFKPEGDKNP